VPVVAKTPMAEEEEEKIAIIQFPDVEQVPSLGGKMDTVGARAGTFTHLLH
jgi:hypothetical protein